MSRWSRALAPDDVLRDPGYRRLFLSVLVGSFGAQVTMLALPLTAALLLKADAIQMGLLTAAEVLPFALFSLPGGVWLDRVRKLPVFVAGELLLALALATVPLAHWAGWLGMGWLYGVGFLAGMVHTVSGTAAQIVLTQVVARERLVQAHARNALAGSTAEVMGPGVAGALIQALGAPLALLVDSLLLAGSAAILRGVKVTEQLSERVRAESFGQAMRHFGGELKVGLRFVRSQRMLLVLAAIVGAWQFCHNAVIAVQVLHASRDLGMSERAIGLAYMAMGVGSLAAGSRGDVLSQRFGPGPVLTLGVVLCALGWLLPALWPHGQLGVVAFVAMLVLVSCGAVLVFINFLALRQAITPDALLGRMTSTMRWLILLPAAPGAMVGGWLGQHVSLTGAMALAAALASLTALAAWRTPVIRQLKVLPKPAQAVPPAADGASAG